MEQKMNKDQYANTRLQLFGLMKILLDLDLKGFIETANAALIAGRVMAPEMHINGTISLISEILIASKALELQTLLRVQKTTDA